MRLRAVRRRRTESRRRSAFPVRTESRRLTFQVQHDHFGDELPVPAIPLQGKLDVGPGRVAVLERIIANVVAVVDQCRPVEKLEEADRHVTVNLRDPPRTDLELRMEPVPALVGVIIPGTGVLLEPLPFVPTDQIAAVGAVNRPFVEMGPVELTCETFVVSTMSASRCKIQSCAPIWSNPR